MRKHESKIIKEMTRPERASSNRSLLGKTMKAPERREKSPMDKSADRKSKKTLTRNDKLTQSKSSFKLMSNSNEPLHKQRPIKTYSNMDRSTKATTPRNFEGRKISTLGQVKEGFSKYLKPSDSSAHKYRQASSRLHNDHRLAPSASSAILSNNQ